MELRAILFDVNGTLIDIETDEGLDRIYKAISRYLTYQDIHLAPEAIHEQYFAVMQEQRAASPERHPEFDAVAVWRELLRRHGSPATQALPGEKLQQMPLFLAELHRALARKRLRRYPGVRRVLKQLHGTYRLGVVTDAQSAYAGPELRMTGLYSFFDVCIVSGDYGYRKPDARLFGHALAALGVTPDQAIYVGNDMYCDIFGAQRAGLRAVFFPTEYGRKEHEQTRPDYVIRRFADLPAAVAAFAGRD
jgi:putative hydrolase of the HAD superfamily